MSRARTEILARIRAALADRPPVPEVPWGYGRAVGTGDLDAVERFVARVGDYRARVDRVDRAGIGVVITGSSELVGVWCDRSGSCR